MSGLFCDHTIKGPGGVLGAAGPRFFRSNGIPISGEMFFDTADINSLRRDGLLADVIEHEMGHIVSLGGYAPCFLIHARGALADLTPELSLETLKIGMGTIWVRTGVTTRGSLCRYFGENANREWQALSGCTRLVPTELQGGGGTACGHWDETCLVDEVCPHQLPFALDSMLICRSGCNSARGRHDRCLT